MPESQDPVYKITTNTFKTKHRVAELCVHPACSEKTPGLDWVLVGVLEVAGSSCRVNSVLRTLITRCEHFYSKQAYLQQHATPEFCLIFIRFREQPWLLLPMGSLYKPKQVLMLLFITAGAGPGGEPSPNGDISTAWLITWHEVSTFRLQLATVPWLCGWSGSRRNTALLRTRLFCWNKGSLQAGKRVVLILVCLEIKWPMSLSMSEILWHH